MVYFKAVTIKVSVENLPSKDEAYIFLAQYLYQCHSILKQQKHKIIDKEFTPPPDSGMEWMVNALQFSLAALNGWYKSG